ncbi:hypothetical protein KPL76_03600 [Subtercola sp. PAMC28395]|nr:hypothetical protein KPL76_03600 [Subtercola sp. PAMC28395]
MLSLTAVIGLCVGIWAEFFHRSFYDTFPGLGLHWLIMMGPFNDHLISDVGSFYLALSAISITAIFTRSAFPGRLAGLGWAIFGVLHFYYHATNLMGSTTDRVGNLVTLGLSALLGIILLFPSRRPLTTKENPQ